MQAFTLAAITDAGKNKLRHKNQQSQWTVKYRSRSAGQGACLKGMSRTIESSVKPPIINIHFYIDHSNLHIS